MSLFKRQEELYKEQYDLSQVAFAGGNYEQARAIKKKQDEAYKKYMFYKNFNKARKEAENDNK